MWRLHERKTDDIKVISYAKSRAWVIKSKPQMIKSIKQFFYLSDSVHLQCCKYEVKSSWCGCADLCGTAAGPTGSGSSAAGLSEPGRQNLRCRPSCSHTAGTPAGLDEPGSPERPAEGRGGGGQRETDSSDTSEIFSGGNNTYSGVLTACSFTAIHWECLRMAAIPPLNVFLMVPFLCRERWLPPSKPPRPRHRGGREILGVNMDFTTPLRKREKEARDQIWQYSMSYSPQMQ